MKNSTRLILEISSDEEAGFGDTRNAGGVYGVDGKGFGDEEDHNWLTKLLGEVDKNKDGDSVDVELTSDVIMNPQKKPRLQSSKSSPEVVAIEGDDDDDCVILDGDPDKSVLLGNSGVHDGGDNNEDDLIIVGEKGEVACRDFPHPRHLCANFPFASTHHEVHCRQCHCYVCDSHAPCANWGTGSSSIDHCHASDKETYWRSERKSKKIGDNKPAPVTITSFFNKGVNFPTVAPPKPRSLSANQCSTPAITSPPRTTLLANQSVNPVLAPPQLNPPVLRNQSLRPMASNPNQTPGCNVPRISRFVHPPAVFKRTGYSGASQNNKSYGGSQLSTDPSLNRCHALQTTSLNRFQSSNHQLNTGGTHAQPKSSTPPAMDVGHANCIPSQLPQVQPLQYPSSNSVVNARPNFQLPDFVFQPNCPLPSQTVASNQLNPRSITPSINPMGNNIFEDQISQPHPSSLLIDGQNSFQQGTQSVFNLQAPADISLLESALPAADTSQLNQTVTGDDHGQNVAAAIDDFFQQSLAAVPEYNNAPRLDVSDCFLFESWMFQNHSLTGALTVPVSPQWNVFSSEPDPDALLDI